MIDRISYSVLVGCVTFELSDIDVVNEVIGHFSTENSSVGGDGLG